MVNSTPLLGKFREKKKRHKNESRTRSQHLSVSLAKNKPLFLHILPSSSKTFEVVEEMKRKKDTQKEPTFMYFFARVFPFKTEEKRVFNCRFCLKIAPFFAPKDRRFFAILLLLFFSRKKITHKSRAEERRETVLSKEFSVIYV